MVKVGVSELSRGPREREEEGRRDDLLKFADVGRSLIPVETS